MATCHRLRWRSRIALTLTAVTSSASIPAPAHATTTTTDQERAAHTAVSDAERATGRHDDRIDDDPRLMHAGDADDDGTESPSVSIAPAEESRGVVFTRDRLDTTTTRYAAVLGASSTAMPAWKIGGDVELTSLPDGRISLADAEGHLVGGIEAPWAVDASGQRLDTRYVVEGRTVTQHVTVTPSTVFPVVADPTVSRSPFSTTVAFTRGESYSVVGTIASCAALLSKSPVPLLRAITLGCAGFAAFSGAQLAGGKCLRLHFAGAAYPFATWWPTFPEC
jgi:hypothetical protein